MTDRIMKHGDLSLFLFTLIIGYNKGAFAHTYSHIFIHRPFSESKMEVPHFFTILRLPRKLPSDQCDRRFQVVTNHWAAEGDPHARCCQQVTAGGFTSRLPMSWLTTRPQEMALSRQRTWRVQTSLGRKERQNSKWKNERKERKKKEGKGGGGKGVAAESNTTQST